MGGASFTFTGVVHHIGEVETFKTYSKRVVVLSDDDPKYPQLVPFEFGGKNVDKADQFRVGDEISVTFSLRGREWTKDGVTKYFGSLDAFKVEVTRATRQESSSPPSGHVGGGPGSTDPGDLPF